MALGIADLGAEGGAEGVHVAEGHGEVLGVELAGDRETCRLAEEVLAEVDAAVLLQRGILGIKRGDAEHLARALTVGAGNERSVDVDEAALLEKLMHGLGGDGAHAEGGREEIGAGPEMLDGAQKFHAVALLLQGVVRGGHALHRDLVGLELKGLPGLGRERQNAADDQGRAHVLVGDLVVIVELAALEHDLQGFEAGAVVELDKAEVLHIADGSDPAADGHALPVKGGGVGIDAGNFLTLHGNLPFTARRRV